jgi:hypothetical protein
VPNRAADGDQQRTVATESGRQGLSEQALLAGLVAQPLRLNRVKVGRVIVCCVSALRSASSEPKASSLVIGPWPGPYHRIMPRSDRRSRIPNGLAERIDRVRGDEPFEHWVRHQLEASVLEHERELGLVSDKQGDQIERQGMRLEHMRDRLSQDPD